MNPQPQTPPIADPEHPFSVFRNWISVSGLVLTLGGLFSFFLLLLLDVMAKHSIPMWAFSPTWSHRRSSSGVGDLCLWRVVAATADY